MKHLKLFFALFAMLALGVTNAWGAEVTFDATSDKGSTSTGAVSFEKDGITLSAENGALGNGTDYRIYKNTKLTISSSVGSITNIAFTFKSASYDGGGWSASYQPNAAEWTSPVANGEQARITKIVVTYTPSTGGGETPGEGGGEEPTPDPEEPETPGIGNDATMAAGTNGSTCTVNGKEGIKVGTSSKGGDMKITVPAGATMLHVYAAAWNKVSGLSLNITPNDKVTTTSIALTADAGISGNSPFTLSGDEADYLFDIPLTNITTETTLTFTSSSEKRFVVWGATYETAGSGEPEPVIVKTLKSIAISGQKTTFEQGDIFKFDGTCTATYSVTKDGVAQADQTAKVEPTSVSTPDMNQLGTQTVTVTYTEGEVTKTAEYAITIEEAPTYDFRKIEGFDDWESSYIEHIVEYADAKVTFASADKNGSTITDQPVTKGGDVSLVLTDGMNIATVKWVCTQWGTKAQTITLHYSKDGGVTYTSTGITSNNFTISSDNLPTGTNAVKITFSSTSNQVGIKSCTITKVEAAAITQVPAPQFSLQGGAYDGAQSVELTCTMADATIYYTTDGNDPTTSSSVYSTAIQVTESMTIKAYAVKEGLEDSPVVEATYEISAPADVVLDFTTNNWELPSGSANKVTTEASYTDGTYTVSVAGTNGHYFDTNNLITGKKDAYIVLPIFNKPIVKIVCEGVDAGSGSVIFNVFVDDEAVSTAVTSCKVDQTFLIAEDKQVANVAHVIKVTNENNLRIAKIKIYLGEAPAVEKPIIGGEEEFVASTEVSITCATTGAKIYYTTDETTPTDASPEYTTPFELTETKTVKAIAYVDGQASAVATKTFTFIETITCVQAAEIALAQSANNVQTEKKYRIVAYVTETLSGVSSNQQSFKVVDNIGDESVFQSYYCNVPEAMAAGMKVEMIGKLSKYNDAAQMKNGDVTILEKPIAEPKILGADAFETSTQVTITAEEGLKIFYTLNGDDPTTSSTEYSAPFELSATTTVKAIAYNSTTAKSSAVAEKTFTKTDIPTKTVAEFIAAEGGRCYLEGIVSNITNTTYGNFDLTDASGEIYIYGCLNASGESKKFATLGVKEGDKIKVIADTYELYEGTKQEAKNVQYVSHISAATITIANITMEVGETKTISATLDPAEAEVTYTIKENTANAISLSGNTITALAEGTATITATVAEGATYLSNSVDFTVIVGPKAESDEVVILAEHNGQWYALKAEDLNGEKKVLAALAVTYFNGTLYNVNESDKISITWTRTVVGDQVTFKNGTNYLYVANPSKTELSLNATAFSWTYDAVLDTYTSNNGARTFLYSSEANGFKNFAINNNVGTKNYSGYPVVTAPVYTTGDVTYTRATTAGKFGTICLPFGSTNYTGAEFFEFVGSETGKVYIGSVDELVAGVPYIFLASATQVVVTSDGTTAATPGDSNGLYGTFTNDTEVAIGNYILKDNAICEVAAPCWVNAYRAYIVMSEVPTGVPTQMPGRRYIGMGVQGENAETGFENITAPEGETKKVLINGQLIIIRDGEMYNAQGQRL